MTKTKRNLEKKLEKDIIEKKHCRFNKSDACSQVLQLMDKDFEYGDALRKVLDEDKNLLKSSLETELDFYV